MNFALIQTFQSSQALEEKSYLNVTSAPYCLSYLTWE